MSGKPAVNYNAVKCFLAKSDPGDAMLPLLHELEKLTAGHINFVICLKVGCRGPVFTNLEGEQAEFFILPRR
jgi:hypothetical protein